jgi:hypothetical protein
MKHFILLACLLSIVSVSPAEAKGKKAPKKPAVKIHASGPTITAVSGDSISLDKQTYKITATTQITVDGRRASAGALKTGMQASVTPSGIDRSSALSITASSAQ